MHPGADHEYLDLLRLVLMEGEPRETRSGRVLSVFGRSMIFNLQEGFPLLTTKRLFWKGIVEELLWMLRGETNVRSLQAAGVHIWDEWAREEGELGPIYGWQWRFWGLGPGNGIDQIAHLVEGLRENPTSRRHLLSAWNVGELDEMALQPCHVLAQWYVRGGTRLDCQLYQRSADIFLGLPFNIASYALLTHMLAHVTGLEAGIFTHVLGDAHLYVNHLDQARVQLERFPRMPPWLELHGPRDTIDGWSRKEHIRLVGYDPHGPLGAEVAK